MKYFFLIAMVALGTLCNSKADSFEARFTNYNCSISFPQGWMITKTPPPKMLLAAVSTNHQFTVALVALPIRPGDEKNALAEMNTNLKRLMGKGGQPVVEGQKNVGGIPFHTFTAQVNTNTSGTAYTASAGFWLYMIQTSSKKDNAGTDTNILNVVNSFHLLSAPPKWK